jgi:hypothetical protein
MVLIQFPYEAKSRPRTFEPPFNLLLSRVLPAGNNWQRSEYFETTGDEQLVLGRNDPDAYRVSWLVDYTMCAGQPSI